MVFRKRAMEALVNSLTWAGRNVFLTGHTGFKGAWLSRMLLRAGANVYGFSLPPETDPSLYQALMLERDLHSIYGDIRDRDALAAAIASSGASVVFHLAAQPLVRRSYRDPVSTFDTNVMGTVNVLDLCCSAESVEVVVAATTDKCYANNGAGIAFREDDPLGGHDPYSSSKAAAEIIAGSYRDSFFKPRGKKLATIRAGNVIGGGDWSEDRLIPDIVRAAFQGEPLLLRNPEHVRPWQHVVDALVGYVRIAERAIAGEPVDEAWNIGPGHDDAITVQTIADSFLSKRPDVTYQVERSSLHEAKTLMLDVTKVRKRVGLASRLTAAEALRYTVEWYESFYRGDDVGSITDRQIDSILS